MEELKRIENDLVPVYETDKGEKVVYGTELHEVLGVKSNYREWSARRFADIEAVDNEDFEGVEISTASGQIKKDHIIKLDTAKEMAMLERNEKGKQVRRYFIQIEKKYKAMEAQQRVKWSQVSIKNQWLLDREEEFEFLCKAYNFSRKRLFHHILRDISNIYNIDGYRLLYKRDVGHTPEYIMDVVAYYPELRKAADETIYKHIEFRLAR